MSIASTQVLERSTSYVAARRSTAPSDRALIARIADGDQAALRELANRHYTRIFRFVLRFIADRGLAEDVVNDILLAVWRQAAHFEHRSSVATWLLGIARYKALDARRRRRASTVGLDEAEEAALVDETSRPDADIQRTDSSAYLRRCIDALPAEQGLLIDLVYYHGKSVTEAAIIVGIPANTVKTRMFLARKKLAAMLALEANGGRRASP